MIYHGLYCGRGMHQAAALQLRVAVEALLRELDRKKTQSMECGTLYHACHSLRLFQQRRSAAQK